DAAVDAQTDEAALARAFEEGGTVGLMDEAERQAKAMRPGQVNADGVFIPEPEPGRPYHANADGKYDPAGTTNASREQFPDGYEPDPIIEKWQEWVELSDKEKLARGERDTADGVRDRGGPGGSIDEPDGRDDRRHPIARRDAAPEETVVRASSQQLVPIRSKTGELLALVRPETARSWGGNLPALLDGKGALRSEPMELEAADDFRALASGVHLTLMGGALILLAAAAFVAACTGLLIHYWSKEAAP